MFLHVGTKYDVCRFNRTGDIHIDSCLEKTYRERIVSGYWHTGTVNCLAQSVRAWMGDRISMSISGDSLSNETLNREHWRCSCSDSMNFPFESIWCNFQ